MLEPEYLAGAADPVVQIFSDAENEIVADVAKRITKMGYISDTSAWQLQKAQELGLLSKDVDKILAQATGLSEREIRKLMEEAGVKAISFDDMIYRAAGLKPLGLSQSPALSAILMQGCDNTYKLIGNYTHTTANLTEVAFRNLCDKAYLQIMSGAYDPNTAIHRAIVELARKDIAQIAYPSGHISSMENAVRRAVTTGVNQSIAKLQLARAEEMGCELVEVSSHAGARPSHAEWQGQVYCIKGNHKRYKDFYRATHYGDGDGLCGWNCYHNFYPFFEGLSTQAFSHDPSKDAGRSNAEDYENQQKQRRYERMVRAAKKECVTLDAAIKNADGQLKEDLQRDFAQASVKLKQREATLQDFVDRTGRTRLTEREQVPGFGHSVSSKAVWANRKNQNQP